MTEVVFETERLRVRRWQDSDLSDLMAVYGDKDAMQWVGDGDPITHEECRRWIEVTYANYEIYGYGMFAVELKDVQGVVGFCGIVHPGGQKEAEVKYAYLRSHWGRGLATEALAGLLQYAVSQHGIRYLIATTAPENKASHHVLTKVGMSYGDLKVDEDGRHTQVFEYVS